MTPICDFFLFTLSIPLSWCNLVFSIIYWPLYNSKSSIANESASQFGKITFRPPSLIMALGSCITWRKPCVNTLTSIPREQDELVSARSDAGSDKTPTPSKASTPLLVPLLAKDLFTKFMKVFIEMTQAQVEPRKHSLKAKTPETYWGKSHIKWYHFCQQCEDYFKTSSTNVMNHILFATSFLRGFISIRWAQYKRRHKNAPRIMWSEFKVFFQKDLESSQAFIDSIWSKFRRDS